jgi:hypothetical protein
MNGEHANMGISRSQAMPSNEASAQATKVRRTRTPRRCVPTGKTCRTPKSPKERRFPKRRIARPSAGWGQPALPRAFAARPRNAAFPSGELRVHRRVGDNPPYLVRLQHAQGTPLSQAANGASVGGLGTTRPTSCVVQHTQDPLTRRCPAFR